MNLCCSGKHYWFEVADAEKCCNPKYKRCLEVITTEDFRVGYFHYWLDIEAETNKIKVKE
jgi:hypothetical protein